MSQQAAGVSPLQVDRPAPAHLSARAREIWAATVAKQDATWNARTTDHLLAAYCDCAADLEFFQKRKLRAQEDPENWAKDMLASLEALAVCEKRILALETKLRLTPQSSMHQSQRGGAGAPPAPWGGGA